MADLAMHRDDQLRTQPAIERGEFGLSRMAADVDMRLLFGDGEHLLGGELVHDPPDRDLVARNLFRGEYNRVARFQLDLVDVARHPRERGARFALPAGRDHHHPVARQPPRLVEIERRREVLQITTHAYATTGRRACWDRGCT